MLGKILRINSNGTIPNDNPFFNHGHRKQSIDLGPRLAQSVYVCVSTGNGPDVHQRRRAKYVGRDQRWHCGLELRLAHEEGPSANPNFRPPLFAYQHGFGATTGCAIAGGAFYNPATVQFPQSFVGKYFFADLCSGWIRVFDPASGTASGFASGISSPVDLKVGADGSLYYLARGSGSNTGALFRVQFAGPMLVTETGSDIAIALDSFTMLSDPFSLTNPFNFSSDQADAADAVCDEHGSVAG